MYRLLTASNSAIMSHITTQHLLTENQSQHYYLSANTNVATSDSQ